MNQYWPSNIKTSLVHQFTSFMQLKKVDIENTMELN